MSIEIVDFNKELLVDFVYDGLENNVANIDITDIAGFYASIGSAYVGIIDNRVIGIGGVYPLWRDWGSAWLFLNREVSKYKVSVFKGILAKMNESIKKYDIKVLSVQCLDDSFEAHTLLTHLGFVKNKEIKMALYGRKA